ncbi:MAG TPA: YcxB family protein [Acidobacteriaceae bacterium]|nr:YcxB family protein [Acidobacteriaceae bacterium]
MPVDISFDFSRELYQKSLQLRRRSFLGVRVIYLLNNFLFPMFAVLFLIFAVLAKQHGDEDGAFSFSTIAVTFLIGSAVIWLVLWVKTKRVYESTFPENSTSREVELTLDDTGVNAIVSGLISTHYEWQSIARMVEGDNLILLFPNKKRFIPILLTKLNPNEAEEVRQVVRDNVKAR